jgi:hypothetical protein
MLALALALITAQKGITANIYRDVPVRLSEINERLNHGHLAPLEPIYGCYIGAFIANEDEIHTLIPTNFSDLRDPGEFQEIVGKRHSIYFNYANLEIKGFPEQEAMLLKRRMAAFHIGLEPKKLAMVTDEPDGSLHRFARLCAKSEAPVFVRFASEYNDPSEQEAWGGNADIYKQKFRLFARVMKEEFQKYSAEKHARGLPAPPQNYAMVWCVTNDGPHDFDRYFPGDDVVDWVGVNFYSVLYHNNNLNHPGDRENPADFIRQIYNTYSSRHPICIGEWAATTGRKGGHPRPDFAITKIGQLYSSLPRLYPRLKCADYFSMNAIRYAPEGHQTNNYSLLESHGVAEQYGKMISNPYFLKKVFKTGQDAIANAPFEIVKCGENVRVRGKQRFSAYVRASVERPFVTWKLNGRVIGEPTDIPGDHEVIIDTKTFPNGPATLILSVKSGSTTVIKKVNLLVAN